MVIFHNMHSCPSKHGIHKISSLSGTYGNNLHVRLTLDFLVIFPNSNNVMMRSSFSLPQVPGVHTSIGKPKNEWIVSPPASMAATPVGANVMNSLSDTCCTLCKKVVLPVPALPVKKKHELVSVINL